jgi:hypothetical protein
MELVNGKELCFLCGTDWTLKYYLDEFRIQRIKPIYDTYVISLTHVWSADHLGWFGGGICTCSPFSEGLLFMQWPSIQRNALADAVLSIFQYYVLYTFDLLAFSVVTARMQGASCIRPQLLFGRTLSHEQRDQPHCINIVIKQRYIICFHIHSLDIPKIVSSMRSLKINVQVNAVIRLIENIVSTWWVMQVIQWFIRRLRS